MHCVLKKILKITKNQFSNVGKKWKEIKKNDINIKYRLKNGINEETNGKNDKNRERWQPWQDESDSLLYRKVEDINKLFG